MTPMNDLLSRKMSIYLLFMYAKLHFLPVSMRHGVTPGSDQSSSDLQNVLRTIKITFYLYFFSFFRLCKNNCFKACNTERWWREDKNRKRDNSTTRNPHMLREICTKPYANTACPPKQGPIKDLGAQNWTHPIRPISSEKSGGQYNPGLCFTLMNKQKHRSGESINEYSWLNKTPTSLCYQ